MSAKRTLGDFNFGKPRHRSLVWPMLKADTRGRHAVVSHDGTTVTFLCRCGRSYVKNYGLGRPSKRISATGVHFLVRYWRSGQGGGSGVSAPPCLACRKSYRDTGRLPEPKR